MVLNFLRLASTPTGGFLLQTAAVRYSLRDRATQEPFTLDLLSTVHLAEPAYYSGLQEACTDYDRVLFEIIADEDLAPRDSTGVRRLRVPLQATPEQRALAARHQLSAQMDAFDATRENWVVADMPRAEIAEVQQRLSQTSLAEPAQDVLRVLAYGPASRGRGRSGFGWAFRLVLCLLPAPEAALLLDDWISSGGAPVAPVLGALARSLASLDLPTAQRLSFAQTLATGEATQWGGGALQLVQARNGRAVEEVEAAVGAGCRRLALLYGALHMRDLRGKLEEAYEIVEVDEPEWRTAWSIPVEGAGSSAPPTGTLLLATAGLLAVDGSDWVATVEDLLQSLLDLHLLQAALVAALYLVRHGVLYLALARWAFEWERRWFLFGD